MDISIKYIKMCEAAQEIQELRCWDEDGNNFQDNDFFYGKEPSGDCDNVIFESMPDFEDSNVKVWLPRQDQLQEMLKLDCKPWDFVRYFYKKMEGKITQYYLQFDSMEQLWLAYIMQKKYNKIWNEEKQEWNTEN